MENGICACMMQNANIERIGAQRLQQMQHPSLLSMPAARTASAAK
jgi:hypothetical protein